MSDPLDLEYFVAAVRNCTDRKCQSLSLRKALIKSAVRKNGEREDRTIKNLLFPPSIIEKVLSREMIQKVLRCQCRICRCPPGGRDLLSDDTLTGAVTKDGDEADMQRRLFAALLYMGAGFAVRHVCSFYTRGLELTTQPQVESLREELFKPLQESGIFPGDEDVTNIFKAIFEQIMRIFSAPRLEIASNVTDLRGKNLPFLKTEELGNKVDKSSFGRLFAFEIHPEFRGKSIPVKLVRKELVLNDTDVEERRTLEFLARCGQPNLIRLLFWYKYDDKINYVFPRYPGSLQQVLEGKMPEPSRAQLPAKYIGSKLRHWLWQGMVDMIAALKFFHSPEDPGLGLGPLIAAHFDLKPANVLVDNDGTLIVTDFGQARIKQLRSGYGTLLTAQAGDLNYQPPPLGLPVPGHTASPSSIDESSWSRAYDVWSTACIMTEVIEYITNGGPDGFKSFRESRRTEHDSSIAFWKPLPQGGYELKQSVQRVLKRFRSLKDPYLNTVTDLLEIMFSIRPEDRKPIADCLGVISTDVPTDNWPLLDIGEVSISGVGTNPQLRNMRTQFTHKTDTHPHRCKMYILRNTSSNRIRVAVGFEKEIIDGTHGPKVSYVISDSAFWKEEEYKLLSLFDPDYKPVPGLPFLCAFGIVHPNLTFHFDDSRRGPQDYYHFLAAVTRQKNVNPYIHMPISECRFLEAPRAILPRKPKAFSGGHVQIWREVTEEEYYGEFTDSLGERKFSTGAAPSSPTIPQHQGTGLSQMSRKNSDPTTASGSAVRVSMKATPHRLVVFLPSSPAAYCLTMNLTSKFNKLQPGLTANAVKSPLHVTVKGIGANFHISNLCPQQGCPGIPLDPEVLERRESLKVDWVELEFRNEKARDDFLNVCTQLKIL